MNNKNGELRVFYSYITYSFFSALKTIDFAILKNNSEVFFEKYRLTMASSSLTKN